jgi:Flp pilus assembly pilin Flp
VSLEKLGYPGQRSCISLKRRIITVKAKPLRVLRSLHRDESGQDLIEHALLSALIALKLAMGALASNIDHAFSAIGSALSNAFSIHH